MCIVHSGTQPTYSAYMNIHTEQGGSFIMHPSTSPNVRLCHRRTARPFISGVFDLIKHHVLVGTCRSGHLHTDAATELTRPLTRSHHYVITRDHMMMISLLSPLTTTAAAVAAAAHDCCDRFDVSTIGGEVEAVCTGVLADIDTALSSMVGEAHGCVRRVHKSEVGRSWENRTKGGRGRRKRGGGD